MKIETTGRNNHPGRKLLKIALACWLAAAASAAMAADPSALAYDAFVKQGQDDVQIYEGLLRQGLTLLAGASPSAVTPDGSWGPFNHRGIKKKFGWTAETYNYGQTSQKYFLLSDVRQDVARAFNRVVLGKDAVLGWMGVGRSGQVLPYGVFVPVSGNSIILPEAWLQQQKEKREKRAAYAAGKASLAGVANDSNELASYGLFWLDRFVAAGIVGTLTDMKTVKNGLESLID